MTSAVPQLSALAGTILARNTQLMNKSLSQKGPTHMCSHTAMSRENVRPFSLAWLKRPRSKPRLPPSVSAQTYDLIRRSVFFDAEFYFQAYPDVGANGMDPVLHYLLYGGSEGRNPGPNFSTSQYLIQ